MLTKKIECRVNPEHGKPEHYTFNARWKVNEIKRILDRFGTEDGFDAFVEFDSVRFGVETETVDLSFCPWSWDIFEEALKRSACCIIANEMLDQFPYYRKLFDQYKSELGMADEAFYY